MSNINLKDHPQIFRDRPQQIWVVSQSTYGIIGASVTEEGAHQIPEVIQPQQLPVHVTEVTLHRPSLQPIYGGQTLLEALWAEMDRLMAGLMTEQDAEGDRYRAQELAWVIAIVTNAYAPSVDQVRAEALRRWNEEADQDDMNTRPQGADQ